MKARATAVAACRPYLSVCSTWVAGWCFFRAALLSSSFLAGCLTGAAPAGCLTEDAPDGCLTGAAPAGCLTEDAPAGCLTGGGGGGTAAAAAAAVEDSVLAITPTPELNNGFSCLLPNWTRDRGCTLDASGPTDFPGGKNQKLTMATIAKVPARIPAHQSHGLRCLAAACSAAGMPGWGI